MTGLLTFIHADNYGALLQAYALQQTLKSMGHDNEFLNFDPPEDAAEKDLSHVPAPIRKKMEENIRSQKLRSALFAEFRKKYLTVSAPLDPADQEAMDRAYEKFIVGSDQVWNGGITGGNPVYTLAFADPKKRYSYAASFGGSEGVEKATGFFWTELSKFQKISLREDTAAKLCFEKTGIKPGVHVDPCLLRTGGEWLELLDNGEAGKNYVLLFLITYDEALVQKAKQYAGEQGLSLKVVTASYIPVFGYESFIETGVTDWLRLIRDAGAVFCDSFHAAVFSILFGKRFYLNISAGALAGRSARLVQLLDLCGLKANCINENTDDPKIRQVLEQERQRGLAYLESIYK